LQISLFICKRLLRVVEALAAKTIKKELQ